MDMHSWTRPDERPFVRRLLDLANRAQTAYRLAVTDFLTPRERIIAESVAANQGLTVAFWGGYDAAERTRAVICPPYVEPEASDFQVETLEVVADPGAAFVHGQLLGSLLGTGIERKKVGDIAVTSATTANVVVAADLVDYIRGNWRKAGRFNIETRPLDSHVLWPSANYQEHVITVSSLRLDAIIAAACRWPRSKAQAQIETGQVSLNFMIVEKPDTLLADKDTVSVRGFGRIRLDEIAGETKRGRIRVQIGILHS